MTCAGITESLVCIPYTPINAITAARRTPIYPSPNKRLNTPTSKPTIIVISKPDITIM